MKKLLNLVFVFAVLMGTIASCDKEETAIPDVPSITITPAGDLTLSDNIIKVGLTQDSTIIIGYVVTAPGKISKLVQVIDGASTTVTAAATLGNYTGEISIPVSYEDYEIELKLEVTDASDQVTTKTISIDITGIIPDMPSITITPAGDITLSDDIIKIGLTQDSTIIIDYSVNAPGIISELVEVLDGVSTTATAAATLEDYTGQISIPVSYEDYDIELKLEVTDASDQVTSKTITIEVTAIIPPANALRAVDGGMMGGSNGWGRWDLDIAPIAGFGYWGLADGTDPVKVELRLTVDLYYATLELKNNDGSIDGDDPWWPNGMGSTFAATTFTQAEFDAMTDVSSFDDIVIDQDAVAFAVGSVVLVQTSSGRKCVLYAESYDEPNNDLTFQVKVEDL